MNDVEITDTDSSNICEYGFCGYKNLKQDGHRRKIEWLKERFSEGLTFKILSTPDRESVGFIEYLPGQYAWRPVDAPGYMVIHCIMIHRKEYKGRGYGSLLLEQCVRDAKKAKMHGVAVVTSKDTWMAGDELFLNHGFESVDQAPPSFDLLAKKFKKAPSPKFKGGWEKKSQKYGSGLVIIQCDQCPCVAKCSKDIVETAGIFGVKAQVVELDNHKQAQNAPSAYGVFTILYNGELIANHPIGRTRFINIMKKIRV
ncbi:MAG TPA: GNAT family N-acetyltransferase [bacterium]|nr:GNAT family N-acetyltransferase [bacterium]HQP97760.1 GNAT family N-acetyltransferase [bacterium]